jgi:hypothetical protein
MYAMYEWRKELKQSNKDFTFKDLNNTNWHDFIPAIKALEFVPKVQVNYKCMYRTDIPSRKFVFEAERKNRVDILVLYENIHVFAFKIKDKNGTYLSQAHATPFYLMQQELRDYIVENYKWCSVSALGSLHGARKITVQEKPFTQLKQMQNTMVKKRNKTKELKEKTYQKNTKRWVWKNLREKNIMK